MIQINILSVLWKRRFKVYKQRGVGLSWLMHDGTTVPWTSPCVSGIYKYEISYTVSGILWLKYCREIPCTGFSPVSDYETVIRPKMWSRKFRALRHTRELHYGVDYIDPLILHTLLIHAKIRAKLLKHFVPLYLRLCVLHGCNRLDGSGRRRTDTTDYDISPKIRGVSTHLRVCWYLVPHMLAPLSSLVRS